MNINEYKQKLEDSLNSFKQFEQLALEIEPIIHSFKGKQLNKRMATTIEQKTGLIVHWEARDNYNGGKEYKMSIWGKNDTYNIDYNNKLSFYYFETLDKLQEDLNRYIEQRNDIMHGVNEQKRLELERIDYIQSEVQKMRDNLEQFTDSLSNKQRDFGRISYALKDYVKSQLGF